MDKLQLVVKRLKKIKPLKVILFGSFGTADADEYSDLDLVVIKNTKKRFLKRLIEVSGIIGSDIDKVDVFVYTPQEWKKMIDWGNPFAQEVLRTGRIIYEKKERRGIKMVKASRT